MLLNGDIDKAKWSLRRGDILTRAVIALSLVALIACGIAIGQYVFEVNNAEQQYTAVTNEFVYTGGAGQASGSGTEDLSGLPPVVDWDGLRAINPDINAWIRIPGTTVDYPVLSSETRDEYLRSDIYGNYSLNGCIFADYQNSPDLDADKHVIIYGHHMNAAVMFHDVARYTSPDFFDAHQVIYFETPDTTYVLRPIGVYTVSPDEYDTRQTQFGTTGDFQTYLDGRLQKMGDVHDYTRPTMDKQFTLVTCDNFTTDERRIVVECTVDQQYPTSMVPNVIEGAREEGKTN